jgi:hypothetical protein
MEMSRNRKQLILKVLMVGAQGLEPRTSCV